MKILLTTLMVLFSISNIYSATTIITFDRQSLGVPSDFTQDDFRVSFSSVSGSYGIFDDGNRGNAVGVDNGGSLFMTIESVSNTPFAINSLDYLITANDVELEVLVAGLSGGNNRRGEFSAVTGGYVSMAGFNDPLGYNSLDLFFDTEFFDPSGDIRVDNISLTSIPEPSSTWLLCLGVSFIILKRRCRKQ